MTELEHRLTEEVARLREENRLLREKIDLLIRKIFGGGKSEKLDPNQLELLLSGLEDEPGKPETSAAHDELVEAEPPHRNRSRRRFTDEGRRPRFPENLPVIEEVIDPEPVKACPEAWRQIGEEPERSGDRLHVLQPVGRAKRVKSASDTSMSRATFGSAGRCGASM
jgi:hypothetical protein